MSKRREVEKVLERERGMSFSLLKEKTALANGALSYHIRKSGKIEKRKQAVVHTEKCDNCPLTEFCREKCVFKLLENEKTLKVLELKLQGSRNSEIAEEIGVHRSTVTYHVSKLEEAGLLSEEAEKELSKEGII